MSLRVIPFTLAGFYLTLLRSKMGLVWAHIQLHPVSGICIIIPVCVHKYFSLPLNLSWRTSVMLDPSCSIKPFIHSFTFSCYFSFFVFVIDFIFIFFSFYFIFKLYIIVLVLQISKWIHHRYTYAPHPEPSSLLLPHTIPLGRPSVFVIDFKPNLPIFGRKVRFSDSVGSNC